MPVVKVRSEDAGGTPAVPDDAKFATNILRGFSLGFVFFCSVKFSECGAGNGCAVTVMLPL